MRNSLCVRFSGDRIDLDQYKRLSCEHRDFLVPVSEDGDALNLARALIQVDKEENFCVYKPMATEGEVPDMMLKYNLVSWESTETGVNTSGMRGPTQNMVTVKVITEKVGYDKGCSTKSLSRFVGTSIQLHCNEISCLRVSLSPPFVKPSVPSTG